MKKSIFFLLLAVPLVLTACAFAQEDMTVTMYYPSPYGVYEQVRSNTVVVGWNTPVPANNGELTWGNTNSRGRLAADQGGSIELGSAVAGAQPYVRFNSAGNNARLELTGNNLTFYVNDRLEIRQNNTWWGDMQVGQLYICE